MEEQGLDIPPKQGLLLSAFTGLLPLSHPGPRHPPATTVLLQLEEALERRLLCAPPLPGCAWCPLAFRSVQLTLGKGAWFSMASASRTPACGPCTGYPVHTAVNQPTGPP